MPQRTAALVSPDRALARRVLVTLERWNVTADDSGGDPLAETAAGVFARLVADAALERLSPVKLLALLKHPLARLGAAPGAHLPAVATLEQALLRGPRPRAGSAGLKGALATFRLELSKLRAGEVSSIHRAEPRAALSEASLHRASLLLERVATALAPLERMASSLPSRTLPRSPRPPRGGREREPRPRRHARRVRRHRRRGARCRLRRHRREGAALHGRGGRLCGTVRRRHRRSRGAPSRRPGKPRAHLWPARSTPDERRPRRHWWARRGRLAARSAHRPLAQPADAPCAWPRSAGAAHRPFGARFRAAHRRGGGVSHPRRQGGGYADRGVAISSAPRRGGRGRGMAGRGLTRRVLSRLRP